MQERMLIGTHNSATGEPGKGLLSWLVTPFARCQSKPIEQQYDTGCRLFDLRVRLHDGDLVFAHGLWRSKTNVYKTLELLNNLSTDNDPIYCTIMYEGKLSTYKDYWWLTMCEEIKTRFPNIHLLNVQVKYPWRNLKDFECVKSTQAFKVLDGRSWHTLIPIPWLWSKIYKQHPADEGYTIYDFI